MFLYLLDLYHALHSSERSSESCMQPEAILIHPMLTVDVSLPRVDCFS